VLPWVAGHRLRLNETHHQEESERIIARLLLEVPVP
jgi:hypothetical protein